MMPSCDIHNVLSRANVIVAKDITCDLRNNVSRMTKYTVYRWILNVLDERGLTQAALARYMELDPPKLSRTLTGDRQLRPDEAIKIARFLDLSIDWVLTGDSIYSADDDLMGDASRAILQAAKSKGVKLTLAEAMALTVGLYNHIIKYRKRGEKIAASEGMATLILEKRIS